ncbi:unnamed protein product [Peronospora belbahrii]|uniref:DUF676 domain-containing protein n=1 Tax=Peronospora belbahrii TaxID=622444 RepID=A0AAU9KY94_9STRA|nr:unnamed protein product [Peronospora belbahrii]
MKFYGRSDFSVFASPVVSSDDTSVLYNVLTTFDDDTMMYNYTLVNGIAYLQSKPRNSDSSPPSVQCLRSEQSDIPPINSIVSALNDAVPVSSLSGSMGDTITCDSKIIYKVLVNGFNFAVCVSKNLSFKMYGSDVDIEVEYLNTRVDIVAPILTQGIIDSDFKCIVDVSSSPVSSIGRSLLTGKTVPKNSRKLFSLMSFLFDEKTSCSCKSTPRPCIFIHGLNVKGETSKTVNSLPYWGDIAKHVPCCLSVKFAHLDTIKNSWTQKDQQQKACSCALSVSKSSTNTTIKNTIIVTHSMGTLILAGAVGYGRCKVDSSSTWVSTAAPLLGSMGSDFVQKACAGKSNVILKALTEWEHQCPPSIGMKSLSYQGGSYSSSELNEAYKIVQEVYRTNVSAAMCSDNFSGLLTSYQAKFWVLGAILPHKSSQNDGTVEYKSCSLGVPESSFRNHYTSRFYRTQLNHYDMKFRGGDAILNKAKMPVKWLECLL